MYYYNVKIMQYNVNNIYCLPVCLPLPTTMYIIDIGLHFKPCMYCHYYLSTCLPNDPASYFNAMFYACQSLRLQKSFKEYTFLFTTLFLIIPVL